MRQLDSTARAKLSLTLKCCTRHWMPMILLHLKAEKREMLNIFDTNHLAQLISCATGRYISPEWWTTEKMSVATFFHFGLQKHSMAQTEENYAGIMLECRVRVSRVTSWSIVTVPSQPKVQQHCVRWYIQTFQFCALCYDVWQQGKRHCCTLTSPLPVCTEVRSNCAAQYR